MEIILSHRQQDFDSLASMVAAQKLYPGSVMVMDGKASPHVQEFLALAKDRLPVKKAQDIVWPEVSRVVLVDTHDLHRVGEAGEKVARCSNITIDIFDHHPFDASTSLPDNAVLEPVGACATLLVERLAQSGVTINSFEATIIALGIYEDTGSLLFENTTVRDVQAVAFLLDHGANLGVIAEYLRKPLTEEQKEILHQMMTHGKTEEIGSPVYFTWAESSDYVGGLALLAHRIGEMEGALTAFLLVKMENRVYIIGRSQGKGLAVNQVVRAFGGSGHARAASAAVKGGEIPDLMERLKKEISSHTQAVYTVRDIMSTMVKTISPEATLTETEQILLRYGYTGVPVVDDDRLVGVISRRDVEKALKHGLSHAPVKGFMSSHVVTVPAGARWEEAQRLMVQHDIGRLPVVEEGKVMGIVSRSDVLRAVHGSSIPMEPLLVRERSQALCQDILDLMDQLDEKVRRILHLAGEVGDREKTSVFVVGGFVRDLFLYCPTNDLDLVVEGNGMTFASALAQALPEGELNLHPQFGTARIALADGTHLDIVSARWEYYSHPGALPQVEESCLRDDLFRRDFTINAMAICLNQPRFGELVDYYGGLRDLQQGEIRFLHNLSFIDDPTRMLRAVRFAKRYGFRLSAETRRALGLALENGMLRKVSSERFTEELIYILEEPHYLVMGQALVDLDLLDAWFGKPLLWNFTAGYEGKREEWRLPGRFVSILTDMDDEQISAVLSGLRLPKRLQDAAEAYRRLRAQLLDLLGPGPDRRPLTIVQLDSLLYKVERPLLELLLRAPGLQEQLSPYLEALDRYQPRIDGHALRQAGIEEGRGIGDILARLRLAWLNGEIKTPEEEEIYFRQYFEKQYFKPWLDREQKEEKTCLDLI